VAYDFLSRFRKRSADDPPATEAWPLFAFGKLPVYKDFISIGLTDDPSREFRDWLSHGFSRLWSVRDEYRSAEMPPHAFLLRLPQSRRVAVGALWGSHDQGGLRKFPFALFSILPAGKPATVVLTALDYLPVFEARAREIREKFDEGDSLAAVYQALRGTTIEVPLRTPDQVMARLTEALSASAVGSLAKALFGEEAAARWPLLLAGLDAAGRRPTAGAAAFRLRLGVEPPSPRQLQLWTVLMARASPDGLAPTGVLYRSGGDAPSGVFFFRDVRAEDILLFHPAAVPTDFVEEVPRPPLAAGPEKEAAQPVETAVGRAEPALPVETDPVTAADAGAGLPPDALEPASWGFPLSSLLNRN
jgi:type VI secretion system ImpM family protein